MIPQTLYFSVIQYLILLLPSHSPYKSLIYLIIPWPHLAQLTGYLQQKLQVVSSCCCCQQVACCTWILIFSSAVWQVRHATKFLTKNCQAAKNESYFIWQKKFDFYSCNVVVIVIVIVAVTVAVAVAVLSPRLRALCQLAVTRCVYVMCHTTDSITIFSVACCTQSGK